MYMFSLPYKEELRQGHVTSPRVASNSFHSQSWSQTQAPECGDHGIYCLSYPAQITLFEVGVGPSGSYTNGHSPETMLERSHSTGRCKAPAAMI